MGTNEIINTKKIKLFLVSLLVALVVLLNFYMLNKVITGSTDSKHIEQTSSLTYLQ